MCRPRAGWARGAGCGVRARGFPARAVQLGIPILLLLSGGLRALPQTPGSGWALAWSDEFAGTSLDTSAWTVITGSRRDAQNAAAAVSVTNGALTLRTYTESGVHKTGFISSNGKFDDAFGYWEARIRLHTHNGMWSAFWLQSYTINNTGDNPEANGTEIDVVEHRNVDGSGTSINDKAAINIHWDGYGADHKSVGTTVDNPGGTALEDNWHTFGLLWEAGTNRFYIDGVEVWSQTTAISHQNQFIYLSSEVEDASWAGSIPTGGYGVRGDAANARMEVDYVRFYKRAERLHNSAFDARLGNWTGYGNRSWTTTGGTGGGPGARINPLTADGAAVEQVACGLTPGVEYRLTGWGTVGTSYWPAIYIGAKDFGGIQQMTSTSSGGFARMEVPFTLGMRDTSARVFAYVATQWGDCRADDLCLWREGALSDPGFEYASESEFWTLYGDAFLHTWTPLRSGSVALRFNNPSADRGAEQAVVGLEPNRAYRFSCWARTDNQSFRIGVKNHGAAETYTTATGYGNTWTRFTHAFTTGVSATSATLYLYVPAAQHNSVIDIDDCLLGEPLTAGWTATDIGAVGLDGDVRRRAERWVVRGSGTDIWSTDDTFRLVHAPLEGDGIVSARLRSFETEKTVSKFGVMIRASLATNAPHVYLGWRGDDRMESLRRTAAGAASSSSLTAVGVRGEWVRIRRSGDIFTPEYSTNGTAWIALGSPQTVVMPGAVVAGLALTANDTATWAEGQAESLVVNSAPTISSLADRTINQNTGTGAIAFTIDDPETAAGSLSLSAGSSNTTLVPLAGIVFGGSGSNRTVSVTPAAGRSGAATITVTVSDGSLTASESFTLTVNGPPAAAGTAVSVAEDQFVDIDLRALAGDDLTAVSNLLFTAGVASNGTVTVLADGRTARFVPSPDFNGTARFAYAATDTARDTRLFLHYGFEPPDTAADLRSADLSGNGRTGTLERIGTGDAVVEADSPPALAPHSLASLRLTEAGTGNAARLWRAISATELDFGGGDWTMAGWFQRLSTATDDFIFYLGVGDGYGGNGHELQLYAPSGADRVTLRHYNASNALDVAILSANGLSTGVWHHAAVTFHAAGSNGVAELYVDGASAGTASNLFFDFVQSSPAVFGGHNNTAALTARWFNGRLDDLAIFSDNLSSAEIARLASRPVAHFGGLAATATVSVTVTAANDAPVLSPVAARELGAGQTLAVTNAVTDIDLPAQTMTFGLLAAPGGATVGASSGIVSWRPAVARADSTNLFRVRVADNGSPVLSATQQFDVIVRPLAAATIAQPAVTNGRLRLTISGDAGPDYSVEASTNLVQWDAIFTTNSPAMPLPWLEPSANTYPARFYRIRLGP